MSENILPPTSEAPVGTGFIPPASSPVSPINPTPSIVIPPTSPVIPPASPVIPTVVEGSTPKKFPTFLLFLIPILVIVAVIAIYVLLQARTMYQQTVVIASPSPSPIVSVDPTEGWQSYSATDFSFKMPANWTNYSMKDFSAVPFTYTESSLYLGPNNTTTKPPQLIQITISNIGSYHDTELYPPENCKLTDLTVGIGAIAAKHTLCKGMESNGYIVFPFNKSVYQIDELKSTEQDHQLFNQILSTFKFTDQ